MIRTMPLRVLMLLAAGAILLVESSLRSDPGPGWAVALFLSFGAVLPWSQRGWRL